MCPERYIEHLRGEAVGWGGHRALLDKGVCEEVPCELRPEGEQEAHTDPREGCFVSSGQQVQ